MEVSIGKAFHGQNFLSISMPHAQKCPGPFDIHTFKPDLLKSTACPATLRRMRRNANMVVRFVVSTSKWELRVLNRFSYRWDW